MTTVNKVVTWIVVFILMMVFDQGEPTVICVFGGSCVLPCHFQPDSNILIHWVRRNGVNIPVHSYYEGKDQLGHQEVLYKGRTSLFNEQLSNGNASLHLSAVTLKDQGTYKCFTSSIPKGSNEPLIDLKVKAPVGTVDIKLVQDTVTCSSGGIYPKPELSWSTGPTLQNTTSVHEDDQGLYDISSSLKIVQNDTDLVYSCSVQNEHSAWKATLRQQYITQTTSKSEISLYCNASGVSDITWTFNHSQTILRKQGGQAGPRVEEGWGQHVKLSESGDLLLLVSSATRGGMYTCTLRNTEETFVTNTVLTILQDQHPGRSHIVVLISIAFLGSALGFLFFASV